MHPTVPQLQYNSPACVCPARAGKDRHSMSKDTDKSLFILSPLAKYTEFYQQLLRGVISYQQLGNRLIRLAEQANAFRQLDQVKELAGLVIGLPIKDYQHVGQYYLALSIHRNGKGDIETAQRILEGIVGEIHSSYKAKAILLLAAVSARKGDYDSELYYFTESLKAKGSIDTIITAQRGIAVSKARGGCNDQALKDIESFIPFLRYSNPNTYYDCLNSYAVELGESGRKDEARNVSRIVLASPFIQAYPEWQETARDLREPARSSVFIDSPPAAPQNVVFMPAVEQLQSSAESDSPARVLNMQEWMKQMGKGKKGNEENSSEELSPKHMIYKIISFYVNKDTTDAQRYELWEAAQKIMYKSNSPKPEPDDSEGA
jgi:hypothetical protein